MISTGINAENVKSSNRTAILRLLNDRGTMSRKDISSSLGLTQAAVSIITAEMVAEGILKETGEVSEEKSRQKKKKH